MAVGVQLHDFDVKPMSFYDRTRDVLISKAGGRPVIIMHEIFGLTPAVVDFARLLTDAEFKVYMPVLFGSSDPAAGKIRGIVDFFCVMSEFKLLSNNDPGPWADWIRDLASFAYKENPSGKGVGVIGLCLTGNLALSAALNPCVTAPVMSEPSLPFFRAGGLHVSAAERWAVRMRVSDEGLVIRGYRYEKDWICRRARFKELTSTFKGGFNGTTIPAANCSLHSVFTEDLRDGNGNFRHDELRTLVDYLRARI